MNRTFVAELEFDGGAFAGWQRQPAERTVQGEIEAVLRRLASSHVAAHAAGRTDAGVHALALPVSFAMDGRWDAASLHRALNALVPADCWIRRVRVPVDSEFHARKSALSRRYRYLIGTDPAARSPFRRPYEWALCRPLDGALLNQAAAVVRGTHEFDAFSVRGQPRAHHRCTILGARWRERRGGRGVALEIRADRFLHHMVRMLVGTMVEISLGRRPGSDMARLLALRDNQETSAPAPAAGLYFVSAEYPATAFAAPSEESS